MIEFFMIIMTIFGCYIVKLRIEDKWHKIIRNIVQEEFDFPNGLENWDQIMVNEFFYGRIDK